MNFHCSISPKLNSPTSVVTSAILVTALSAIVASNGSSFANTLQHEKALPIAQKGFNTL